MQINEAQKLAVTEPGSVRILAAPGSGKTRTIVERIKHIISGGVHPSEILSITFTRAAAREMRTRLESDLGDIVKPMQISTFHALALRIVRKWGHLLSYRAGLSVYDDRDQRDIMTAVCKDLNIKKPKPETVLENMDMPKYAAAKAEYRDRVRAANAVDYDMLVEEAIKLLRFEQVREEFHYKHMLIDEFQDLNEAQYTMALALRHEDSFVCATMDLDQNVMSFQGSSVRFGIRLPEDFPGIKTLYLDTCYRCPANVLDAANRLILNNQQRLDKPCRTDNPDGEIKLVSLGTEIDEAKWIARKCRQLNADGIKFADMAILCRTHRLKNLLTGDLKADGLPVNPCGRTQEFFRQPAVLDFLSYLKAITNPFDSFSFKRTLGLPNKDLMWSDLCRCEGMSRSAGVDCLTGAELYFNKSKSGLSDKVKSYLEQMRDWTMRCVTSESNHEAIINEVAKMLSEYHMQCGLTGRAGEVREAALRYTMLAFGFSSIQEFLEHVTESDGQDDIFNQMEQDKPDQVNIMTCHTAKGLEFHSVFIPGLEKGVFPIGAANKDDDEMEQERRLFYVAVTRAERNLYMTNVETRTMWMGPERQEPSLFLAELGLEDERGGF